MLYSAIICEKRNEKMIQKFVNFESFLTLLSNDLSLNSVEITRNENNCNTFQHLIQLIKSLKTQELKNFILSEELFETKMDFILINECLEFCRFSGEKINSKLIENKLLLLSLLFDFGFYGNAMQYCKQLKTCSADDLSTTVTRIIHELESRFDPNYCPQDDNRRSPQRVLNDDDVDDSVVNPSIQSVVDANVAVVQQQHNDNVMTEPMTTATHVFDNRMTSDSSLGTSSSFDFYGQMLSTKPMAMNDNTFQHFNGFVDNNSMTTVQQPVVQQTSMPSMPSTTTDQMSDQMSNVLSFISTSAPTTMPFNENFDENDFKKENEIKEKTIETKEEKKVEQKSRENSSGILSQFFGKFRRKKYIYLSIFLIFLIFLI